MGKWRPFLVLALAGLGNLPGPHTAMGFKVTTWLVDLDMRPVEHAPASKYATQHRLGCINLACVDCSLSGGEKSVGVPQI